MNTLAFIGLVALMIILVAFIKIIIEFLIENQYRLRTYILSTVVNNLSVICSPGLEKYNVSLLFVLI